MKDILKALLKTVSALNKSVEPVTISDNSADEKLIQSSDKLRDLKSVSKDEDKSN